MAGTYNIYKKYKNPVSLDWKNIMDKDLNYFDQFVEADAYGREIGARLEHIYNKILSKSTILNYINNNNISDEYCKKIINIYKGPRISKKSNQSFFRALYDYLVGNEL